MAQHMMGNGKTITIMDKERKSGQMGKCMKDRTIKEASTELVLINGLMDLSILEAGLITYRKEKVSLSEKIKASILVTGDMV